MNRDIDIQNWFPRFIHEGYQKIPYRGRTGPGRRQWYKEFQTWPQSEQLKVVNKFSRLYNSITETKKLDTARRIVARMTELFQLVPWLKEYYRQLNSFRSDIADYDQLVSNVERMFTEENFPQPDIVRRLVDRMAILVRPKLFWKMVDKKKDYDVSEADLKEQWEIFVSAKMSTHEFSDLFVWVLTMIEFSPDQQTSFLERLKAVKAVLNHSFSGPRTGVRLMPLRALSNNVEVKNKLAVVLHASVDGVDLKGVDAKENVDQFLSKLILNETTRCETEVSMDVDQVQTPMVQENPFGPSFPNWVDGLLDENHYTPAQPEPPQESLAMNSNLPALHVPPPMNQQVPPPVDEFQGSLIQPPQPTPNGENHHALRSMLAHFQQQMNILQLKQIEIEAQFRESLQKDLENLQRTQPTVASPFSMTREEYQPMQPMQQAGWPASTFMTPSVLSGSTGTEIDPREMVNASPPSMYSNDPGSFLSRQEEQSLNFFGCPTPAPLRPNPSQSLSPLNPPHKITSMKQANDLTVFQSPPQPTHENSFYSYGLPSPSPLSHMSSGTDGNAASEYAGSVWSQPHAPPPQMFVPEIPVVPDMSVMDVDEPRIEFSNPPYHPPGNGYGETVTPYWVNPFPGSFSQQ